jgi:hypothetical protein
MFDEIKLTYIHLYRSNHLNDIIILMKIFLTSISILIFTLCFHSSTQAQYIQQLVSNAQKMQETKPREIMYLQFDKPSYIIGDTMWFSAFLLDAHSYTPSIKSGIGYVELITDSNSLQKRVAIHIINGHGFAQIPLIKNLAAGAYRIRAYSRWMENFSDSLFFQKDIMIAGGPQNWLLNIAHIDQFQNNGYDSVSTKFFLKDQLGNTVENTLVNIRILNDKEKAVIFSTLMTRHDGSLNINFKVEHKKANEHLVLQVLNNDKETKISFPIATTSFIKKYDIQFMPESGHLLGGIKNYVAFKAIDENGDGVKIAGVIKNNSGDSVASFSSSYKGMGIFFFTPENGLKYHAEIKGIDAIGLPETEKSGTSLHIDNLSNSDSVLVYVHATPDLLGTEFYLLGRYKGLIGYGAGLTLTNAEMRVSVAKSVFGTGINSFDLIKQDGQVMNERPFFINQHDQLKISISTPSSTIMTKDSVSIKIKVTDRDGAPVEGIFSLAVTDNEQVKKDAVTDENILSYFFLTADLKGKIETPGYYISETDIRKQTDLDILLLTQGFVKYNWDTTSAIPPEPEFQITGKTTGLFNKAKKDDQITLISIGKPTILKNTVTDKDGKFVFNDFPLFDTLGFYLQARTNKNKRGTLGISIDEYNFPRINDYKYFTPWPSNVNMDTTLQNSIKKKGNYALQKYGKNYLPDVVVSAKLRVEGSDNLNGPGNYDKAILQSQLEQMKDSSLLDILENRLKISIGLCDKSNYFMVNHARIKFIIDGVKLDMIYDPAMELGNDDPYLSFIKENLKYYTAKDLKGIELMLPFGKYFDQYYNTYLTPKEKKDYNIVLNCPYAFIEVTTYSKKGPFVRHNATADVYRPVPFSYGKISYQPKYTYRQSLDSLRDVRSTIFWHPQIITNKAGESTVYFSSAALPTSYTIWVEGMDLNGHLGYSSKVVKVVDGF